MRPPPSIPTASSIGLTYAEPVPQYPTNIHTLPHTTARNMGPNNYPLLHKKLTTYKNYPSLPQTLDKSITVYNLSKMNELHNQLPENSTFRYTRKIIKTSRDLKLFRINHETIENANRVADDFGTYIIFKNFSDKNIIKSEVLISNETYNEIQYLQDRDQEDLMTHGGHINKTQKIKNNKKTIRSKRNKKSKKNIKKLVNKSIKKIKTKK